MEATYPIALNVPTYVRDRLSAMAKQSGSTIGEAVIHVLREALPHVQESWASRSWPTKRISGLTYRGPRATVQFRWAADLAIPYRTVAYNYLDRALNAGWGHKNRDPLVGEEYELPVAWVLNNALQDHLSRAGQMPVREPDPVAPGVSDGPMVMVPLPVSAVDWMLRARYNRSAFIRSAIETQLPGLAEATVIPPMSRLMPEAPNKSTPVRMTAAMHQRIRDVAKTKGVTMTHLMRAACLTHLAATAAKARA